MLKNMRVATKLALIGLAISVPISVLFFLVLTGTNHDIEFNQKEKYGNEYQRPLERLLRHISEHRLMTQRYFSGAKKGRDPLSEKQSQIDRDFEALEGIDRKFTGVLKTTEEELTKRKKEHFQVDRLRKEWEELKGRWTTLSPVASNDHHLHLFGDLRALISHIGDTSNLIFDPDLDTYYLMDVTLLFRRPRIGSRR